MATHFCCVCGEAYCCAANAALCCSEKKLNKTRNSVPTIDQKLVSCQQTIIELHKQVAALEREVHFLKDELSRAGLFPHSHDNTYPDDMYGG